MPRLTALLLCLILLPAGFARGDGFIVVDDPAVRGGPGHFPFAPLEVVRHRVTVEIDNGVAVTKVDQTFHNPSGRRTEGTYLFPLPEGASIDKFSMDVDGTMTDAELLPADKARRIYEEIVRTQRHPALLEYAGRGAFKARVFPIEPNGDKRIRLQYTQVLTPDSGATEYRYSLNTEKFSAAPLKEVSVTVHLKSDRPLKSVYCPSHNVEVKRDGASAATVTYEETDARPDADFKLIYSADPDPVGITLLTHRADPAEDGYFLLMASPGEASDRGVKVQPKDVCFVLDTSGSMAGPKLDQARRALGFCLANLNEGDRFNVVRFSTEAEVLFDAMAPVDKSHVAEARAFVDKLKPIGGTAIEAALARANELQKAAAGESRPFVTIFLTDGQPTIGETDEDKLVAASGGSGRIFPFGIGADVNTHLLDRIANGTRAFSQYVLPTEDIEVKVSDFYTKIQSPVMTGVKLSFKGDVRASALYPTELPDLYKGQTLLVFGLYSGSGPAAVEGTGTVGGRSVMFAQDVTFPERETKHDFIPKLWATRRIGWLLDEIRLRGESDELKGEVTRLARAHGIVTPYTAYLIIEDESRRNVPVASQTLRGISEDREVRRRAGAVYDSAAANSPALVKSGPQALATARDVGGLKQSTNAQQAQGASGQGLFANQDAPATRPGEAVGYRQSQAQNYARQAAAVNGRAFYLNEGVWVDSRLQVADARKLPRRAVAFNSDAYYALLDAHPDVAKWLALGPQVDVIVGGTVYNVR